jgi:hypothetical protein
MSLQYRPSKVIHFFEPITLRPYGQSLFQALTATDDYEEAGNAYRERRPPGYRFS